MLWTDVMLIDDNLDVIAEDVLDSVERTLGCKLPTDYRAVMTTFGVGTYGGLINFFHPSDIAKQTKRSREIWAQQPEFFWLNPTRIAHGPPRRNPLFCLRRWMAMRSSFARRHRADRLPLGFPIGDRRPPTDFSFCLATTRSSTRCHEVLMIRSFGMEPPPTMSQTPTTFDISYLGGTAAMWSCSLSAPT